MSVSLSELHRKIMEVYEKNDVVQPLMGLRPGYMALVKIGVIAECAECIVEWLPTKPAKERNVKSIESLILYSAQMIPLVCSHALEQYEHEYIGDSVCGMFTAKLGQCASDAGNWLSLFGMGHQALESALTLFKNACDMLENPEDAYSTLVRFANEISTK